MSRRSPQFRGTISPATSHTGTDSPDAAHPTPDWALPRRSRRGYDSDLVEDLFERAKHSYEDVRRERDSLNDELEALRDEVAKLRAEQPLVQNALMSAHRTAREVVAQAEAEAERLREQASEEAHGIVANARKRAEDVVAEADEERARIEEQVARMRNLATGLRSEYVDLIEKAVELLDESQGTHDSVVEMQESLTVAARIAPDA